MKPSELRKLYLSVVNLYGFVFSKDLFKILDHYNITYKKEQIMKDLEARSDKLTQYYFVQKMRKQYLIINPYYSNDDFQILCSHKQDKPFYFPKTYDDLLKYSDIAYRDEKAEEGFNNIFLFVKRHSKNSDQKLTILTDMILTSFKFTFDDDIQEIFKLIEIFEVDLADEKVVKKFITIIQDVSNNLRHPSNNGFTPNELVKMSGPIDLNKVSLKMGPNMRESFLNGESNPVEYLKELEKANLPIMAKESMKKELLDIIAEINKIPKA